MVTILRCSFLYGDSVIHDAFIPVTALPWQHRKTMAYYPFCQGNSPGPVGFRHERVLIKGLYMYMYIHISCLRVLTTVAYWRNKCYLLPSGWMSEKGNQSNCNDQCHISMRVSHSVSTCRDNCVRVYAPLTLAPPSRKIQNRTGATQLSTEPSEGAFDLTRGSAALLGGNLVAG